MVCVLIDLCISKTNFLIKMGWNKFPFLVLGCARVHKWVSFATQIKTLNTKYTHFDSSCALSEASSKTLHLTKCGATSYFHAEN